MRSIFVQIFFFFWMATAVILGVEHVLRLEVLPISFVVAVLFAYCLGRPMLALKDAFRRWSNGDIQARIHTIPRGWNKLVPSDMIGLAHDFNRMADRIHQLFTMQDLVMRDVSHELRSPLTRMQLAICMVKEDKSDSPWLLDSALREIDRLNELISELLALSIMGPAGHMSDPQTFSVEGVFAALIPSMRFEAEAKSVRVDCDLPEKGSILSGSPELIRRAFENVIRNAIRYTPAGAHITIRASTLRLERQGEDNDAVQHACEIVIQDCGPGVPSESLNHLFQPFFRVKSTSEERNDGFGLGLAIAERAIAQHRGKITAENYAQGGLIVRIRLPLVVN